MRRLAVALSVLAFGLVPLANAQVRINEAFTGTPDHIELQNCTNTPIDVSGWTVATWYATTAGATPTAETPVTLAAGTMIPANGFLILEEFGTAGSPGTLPNSIAVGFNYFWVAARTLEIALTDAGGNGVDYMYRDFYGNGTAPHLPAGTNWTGSLTTGIGDSVARNMDVDTDAASDWTDSTAAATTAALNQGQFGGCGGPPSYELNDAAASLDIDGIQSAGYGPAVTNSVVCLASTISLGSNVSGTLYELVANLAPLIPQGTPPSITTANGQILNMDVTHPTTVFLNGGNLPAFASFPGNFSFVVAPAVPVTFSAQAIFTDPSNADGIALTQGVQYVNAASPPPFAGPTTDDGTVLINLAQNGCGPITFLGQSYDSIGVNANGRVTMNAVDGDFSPSIAEAQSDVPFIGYWTDLNPSLGGTISVTDNGSTVSVDYVNVPYFTEANTAVTFSIVFTRVTGDAMITGLTGIPMNPATTVSTSDSIFFGISPGNGATNPGSTTFTFGGGGMQGLGTDMLYEFVDYLTLTAGTPNFAPSLLPGNLSQLLFVTGGGSTVWAGL